MRDDDKTYILHDKNHKTDWLTVGMYWCFVSGGLLLILVGFFV